jgi:Domain of unknown function (DUF4468) with TBP-like fold
MKKPVIILVLFFLFQNSFEQTVVSEIVKVDSTLTKSTLYSNGLTWFAYKFKSSNDVIQMKDPESGKIIGKGIFDFVYQNGKSIPRHITITLTVKDGRYKYEVELEIIREFEITMEAKCLNCGKTTATVIYINGTLQITNITTGRGAYHYDNENVAWMEKGNYKKWKAAVDMELPELRKKVESDIMAQEVVNNKIDMIKINDFTDSLKLEMVKTNTDF